jgi:hypothetical protein
MPITVDELTTETPTDDAPASVRIIDWADELPRPMRTSPFDAIITELRGIGDTARFARLGWDGKAISPNRVNQLRKRYADFEFFQVTKSGEKQTWARYKGPAA